MIWRVLYHDALAAEMESFAEAVQDELLAMAELLARNGPSLGRPHADTLAGSRFANMKELRFRADRGVWRVAFGFDPERRAVLLVAADKSGVAQKRFYRTLIAKADARFAEHLDGLED